MINEIKEELLVKEFNYYERLKESLEQAVDFTKGDKSKAKVSVHEIPVPAELII